MCPFSSDTSLNTLLPDDEYVPDEGQPAVSVFSFFYRDTNWIAENKVLGPDKLAKSESDATTLKSVDRDLVATKTTFPQNQTITTLHGKPMSPLKLRDPLNPLTVCTQMARRRILVEMDFKRGYISLDRNASTEALRQAVMRLLSHWNVSQDDLQILLLDGELLQSSGRPENVRTVTIQT